MCTILASVLVCQQQTGGIASLLLYKEYGADDFPFRKRLPAAAEKQCGQHNHKRLSLL